jgi:phage tail sheath protein FI
MANYVSPGVYVLEKDTSDYPAAINPSVVGIVGFATKGPVDKATLITNGERLVAVFGKPDEDIVGQGLEGSLEILEATNSLYFVRCASSGAMDASSYIQMGACPAVLVSSTIGVTEASSLLVVVKDNASVTKLNKVFAIPSGSVDTVTALKAVMGGDPTNASKISVYDYNGSAVLVGGFAGSGASLQVKDNDNALAGFAEVDASGGFEAYDADVIAYGINFFTSSLAYKVESLYPGTGYNYAITNAGVETGNSISVTTAGGTVGTLNVLQDGVVAESFQSNFVTGEDFIETKINTGGTNLKSNIIKGNIYSDGTDVTVTGLPAFTTILSAGMGIVANGSKGTSGFSGGAPPFVKLVAQSGRKLSSGTDGIPESTDSDAITAIIKGVVSDDGKTGMQNFDNDLLNLSMAAAPGITSDAVQNALVTLAESTKEFLAVLSPPIGFANVQTAIDWSNGLSTERSSAINSSYAALYWPWVKVFSAFDGVDRWYDPAIFGIRQMCVTDEIAESWFAPAGFTRGRLTKPTDVEINLGQGDRDAMYSDGNVINPIVNFPQQGITIFGQRTTQRAPSALDRINVRRMMLIIRKIILRSTRQFAFEPNDPQTWDEIQSLTTSLIDPIARRRGITEYKVQCDSTTNTPDRIEKGELWCKVVIRPTKTAEIIVFELNLINQSASIS